MSLGWSIALVVALALLAGGIGFVIGKGWAEDGDTPLWNQAAKNAQKANPTMRR